MQQDRPSIVITRLKYIIVAPNTVVATSGECEWNVNDFQRILLLCWLWQLFPVALLGLLNNTEYWCRPLHIWLTRWKLTLCRETARCCLLFRTTKVAQQTGRLACRVGAVLSVCWEPSHHCIMTESESAVLCRMQIKRRCRRYTDI